MPLLLPGVKPAALKLWFDEEPLAVSVELKPGGLDDAMPDILAALGERVPTARRTAQVIRAERVEELILELRDPKIQTRESKTRFLATARLIHKPARPGARDVESTRFTLTSPFGLIETEDLRWYLEEYFRWPTGVFAERAKRIEALLPKWGKDLFRAALDSETTQQPLNAWRNAAKDAERRFTVLFDPDLPDGASKKKQAAAEVAAAGLLSLPWELMHDDHGYLFHGKYAVRVRRRLPNRVEQDVRVATLPIRILLVSPRPEDERAGYIDHRISASPLVEAMEKLGDKIVELTVLAPPTFPELEKALTEAAQAKVPFDVVHFDGHGVFNREHGLGSLCFEDPKDSRKLEKRAMMEIDAEKMAGIMRDHRIPLVFLEACETAKVETNPTASVAAKLLERGVISVVAMSHSVLVETARRFVEAFYSEIAAGARIGHALLAGQRALYGDTHRGEIMGAGELRLQDWFVPVLYQEEQDPQLFGELPDKEVQKLQAKKRKLRLGALPEPPPHTFIGRSRDLLALERLLLREPYVVVRGQGGSGKTALAVELARWLVRTGRFARAAFVSVETVSDVRAVLDSIGQQLLPEGSNWSVAHSTD